MINKVVLMGRITRDLELKTTPQGVSVLSFTVAVDRGYARQGEERQADFINIVAWRSTAEFVSKYFTKGQMIAICGRIQTRTWDDQEGKKHYVTEVVADEVSFTESKKNTESAPVSYTTGGNVQEQIPQVNDDFQITADDDDLPF